MNILVVGGGGREHALCWKIRKSPLVKRLYCAPGNAGISKDAECVDIKATDIEGLANFAETKGVDLTVVGPEQPLCMGIVDEFISRGLRIFGPTQKASELESSKVFAKELMRRCSIPTAEYRIFDNFEDCSRYLKETKYPVVIKADGLAAGKGVFICNNKDEGLRSLDALMNKKVFGDSGSRVVVEEFLEGEEASFFVFTDGINFIPLETSQDHKQLYEGDKGPNTGGMGAYSPAPIIEDDFMKRKIVEEVVEPVLEAMRKEGRKFTGVLYVGLMVSGSDVKVLEFNCRLGDPEAEPLMVRMKSDVVPIMLSIAEGRMEADTIEWKEGASVCVVMASKGYPERYATGVELKNLELLDPYDDIILFHAGTKFDGGRIVTSGGRVLCVTSYATTLPKAIDRAYFGVGLIDNDFLYYRGDIGAKAVRKG